MQAVGRILLLLVFSISLLVPSWGQSKGKTSTATKRTTTKTTTTKKTTTQQKKQQKKAGNSRRQDERKRQDPVKNRAGARGAVHGPPGRENSDKKREPCAQPKH